MAPAVSLSSRSRNASCSSSSAGSIHDASDSSFGQRSDDTSSCTTMSSSSSLANASAAASASKSSTVRSSSPFKKQHAAVAASYAADVKRAQSSSKCAHTSIAQAVASLRKEERRSVVDEYQEEVIAHMAHMERETVASVDLMDAQPELRWYMRPYLVDFIIEIHQTFRLRPETLFLTMNIVDRYASKRIVYKRHYQLVGCAALLIAAKFEDAKDKVPLVSELVQMCCSAYDESAFTQMEGHVLSTIGWTLGFPTPEAYLRLTTATSTMVQDRDSKIQSIARFLLEITLFARDFVGTLPSSLASAALFLARYIASQAVDNSMTRESAPSDALEIAEALDQYLLAHVGELSDILVKKYSFSHYSSASACVVKFYTGLQKAQSASLASVGPSRSLSQTPTADAKETEMPRAMPSSSFHTPQRGSKDQTSCARSEEGVDDDTSMHSPSTPASSTMSTPSHLSTHGEEMSRDDDFDDDEESDMPVTPLSLSTVHDPLNGASQKESSGAQTTSALTLPSSGKTSAALRAPSNNGTTQRPVLVVSQHDNRMSA